MSTSQKSSVNNGFAPVYLLVVISLIAVLGGIYYFGIRKGSVTSIPTPQSSIFSDGQEVTIKGTILENHIKGLELDAAAWLEIKTDQGNVNVRYHPGDDECQNSLARDAGLKLQSGDEIEVFGKYSQGFIRTCESLKYYLKKTDQKDETFNWKTYIDGISFKYPPDWVISEKELFGSRSEQLLSSQDKNYRLIVSIQGNYNNLTGKSFATLEEFASHFPDLKEYTSIVLDAQPARKVSKYQFDNSDGAWVYTVYFFSKDASTIYYVQLANAQESENDGLKIFNQILSTFKFVDEKQNISDPASENGITLEAAKQIIPIHPSQLNVSVSDNMRKLKWWGTGEDAGFYKIYRKIKIDKNWTFLTKVEITGDNRGWYEFEDTVAQGDDYIYGVSFVNSLGTESAITASNTN